MILLYDNLASIWGRIGFDGDRLSLDGKPSIRTRKKLKININADDTQLALAA